MKAMNRYIIFAMLILLGIVSCNKSYEPPVFKNVENIQLSKVKDGIVNMKADAILYNPNDVKAKLRGVDIEVFIQGKKVAVMKEKLSLQVLPLSDFSLPMNIGLDISELGLLNSILGFIKGKEFKAHYLGKAKVIIHGVPVSIPIDYHDVLKLR
jgi:LEA14-like dessication related protein